MRPHQCGGGAALSRRAAQGRRFVAPSRRAAPTRRRGAALSRRSSAVSSRRPSVAPSTMLSSPPVSRRVHVADPARLDNVARRAWREASSTRSTSASCMQLHRGDVCSIQTLWELTMLQVGLGRCRCQLGQDLDVADVVNRRFDNDSSFWKRSEPSLTGHRLLRGTCVVLAQEIEEVTP